MGDQIGTDSGPGKMAGDHTMWGVIARPAPCQPTCGEREREMEREHHTEACEGCVLMWGGIVRGVARGHLRDTPPK